MDNRVGTAWGRGMEGRAGESSGGNIGTTVVKQQ